MFPVFALLAVLAAPPGAPSSFSGDDRPFDLLRDLHPTAYEPDPRWRRAWAETQHSRSGIDFVHGSISQHELYTERRIVLNAPIPTGKRAAEDGADAAGDRLRFRFEHEEIGSLDLESARSALELQLRVAGPLAVTVSGFPAYDKARSTAGAGIFVADAARRQYLGAGFELGAPLFNQRSREDARFVREPMRFLGETNLEAGDWRLHATADWSRQSRLVRETPQGSRGVRDLRASTRRTDVTLEWSPARARAWVIGVRHRHLARGERRDHFAGYVDAERVLEDFDFARVVDRADGYADWNGARFRTRGQISGVWAKDRVGLAYEQDYRYRRDELIAGGRVHWNAPVDGLQLGLGYFGNVYRAKRAVDAAPIAPRTPARASESAAGYVDKGDLVVGYVASDLIRTEATVSQQVTRGRFGGGSLKATVLF